MTTEPEYTPPAPFPEAGFVSFQIPGILPSQHEDFMRFKIWAMKGCLFEIYTDDADNNYSLVVLHTKNGISVRFADRCDVDLVTLALP